MTNNPLHIETPVLNSTSLNQLTGQQIYLKMECNQPVGSFKIRGIGRLCQELVDQGIKRLVASSGGNAGLSMAYAARQLGVSATVFMPTTTSAQAIELIKREGAGTLVQGAAWDQANKAALAFVSQSHAGYVSPFDHPSIWAGHSTLVDELVMQMQKPDIIVTAVGGGGLASGILQGLERHGWKDVPVLGVETEGAASLNAALKAGQPVKLDKIETIATTLGARQICDELFQRAQRQPVQSVTVTDKQAVNACLQFLDDHHVLVEPACGAALAVVYEQLPIIKQYESVLVVVCGGVGISFQQMLDYKQHFGL